MATINDLGQSVSEMTNEELMIRLRDLRSSRRIHKGTVARTKKTPAKKLNITVDLIKELEGLMKT